MRQIQAKLLNWIVCNPWIQEKAENKTSAYIIETITRIIARNPKYINIAIAITVGVLGVIGAVCKYLTPSYISIDIDNIINVILATIGTSVTAFGQTSVQPEIKGMDETGAVIKQDVAATRPYTDIVEIQQAAKIEANKIVIQGKANANANK